MLIIQNNTIFFFFFREASETVDNESDVVWVRTAPAELYYRKQPG